MTNHPLSRAFTATETTGEGIRVHVSIEVPGDYVWPDYRECGELAQMAALKTMTSVLRSKTTNEEMPF